jgi:hypothetical protein
MKDHRNTDGLSPTYLNGEYYSKPLQYIFLFLVGKMIKVIA